MIVMPPGSLLAIGKTAVAIYREPERRTALFEDLLARTAMPAGADQTACAAQAARRALIARMLDLTIAGLTDEGAAELEEAAARAEAEQPYDGDFCMLMGG